MAVINLLLKDATSSVRSGWWGGDTDGLLETAGEGRELLGSGSVLKECKS